MKRWPEPTQVEAGQVKPLLVRDKPRADPCVTLCVAVIMCRGNVANLIKNISGYPPRHTHVVFSM